MTCCGQGRAALRVSQAPPPKSPGARPAATGSARTFVAAPSKSLALVRYLGAAPIVALGTVTGHAYRFAIGNPVQSVDARDVAGLLKKGIFRRHA